MSNTNNANRFERLHAVYCTDLLFTANQVAVHDAILAVRAGQELSPAVASVLTILDRLLLAKASEEAILEAETAVFDVWFVCRPR